MRLVLLRRVGRRDATSLIQGLTQSRLKLLTNSDTRGGTTGEPATGTRIAEFVHETNRLVAVTTSGDRFCRAESYDQRIDVADARAFLGHYLNLPQAAAQDARRELRSLRAAGPPLTSLVRTRRTR